MNMTEAGTKYGFVPFLEKKNSTLKSFTELWKIFLQIFTT